MILTDIGIPIFPILRCVSFNEGAISILVGGECVGYTAPFIRNTCNIQFDQQCFMIFRELFTAVQKVVPVLTYDEDFTYIVEELGVPLTYPIDSDR